MAPPDYIAVTIGHAGRLTDIRLQRAIRRVVQIIDKVSPLVPISIGIDGYNNDPRELYEIPEARRFVLQFIEGIQARGIPIERFMGDTRMLIKLCTAAETGTTVEMIGDYTVDKAIEMFNQFVTEARRRLN